MLVVVLVGLLDIATTKALIILGLLPIYAKSISCFIGLLFNFLGRRFLVFPERAPGAWKPQVPTTNS
jgi:putative flippase GtrA